MPAPPPTANGTRSPAANPAATGPSTPATDTRAACSSRPAPGVARRRRVRARRAPGHQGRADRGRRARAGHARAAARGRSAARGLSSATPRNVVDEPKHAVDSGPLDAVGLDGELPADPLAPPPHPRRLPVDALAAPLPDAPRRPEPRRPRRPELPPPPGARGRGARRAAAATPRPSWTPRCRRRRRYAARRRTPRCQPPAPTRRAVDATAPRGTRPGPGCRRTGRRADAPADGPQVWSLHMRTAAARPGAARPARSGPRVRWPHPHPIRWHR